MPVEIIAVGGYNEVGKNCTAIKVDDEVVIIDMGIHLEPYIKYTEDEDIFNISASELIKAGAIPDISAIKELKNKVIAIIPTHGHLDHVGAIPFLAKNFDAPIICTPLTAAIIRNSLKDEKIRLPNEIKILNQNSSINLSKDIKAEFIAMTHSIPHTVMVALHTRYGVVLYANDFKFDSTPTLGQKPNFERLKEIGREGILALIVDSTYASTSTKTPSEAVAKEMLREVMLGTESAGKAVIVTTFSSHLARLKSIIEFGKHMKRKIIFLGRSLAKYVKAGEDTGIINFSRDVKIMKYSRQVNEKLKEINKNPGKYLLVVTGHQAEQKSILAKMARKEIPFNFHSEDEVIFSCKVIPTELNIKNRKDLEKTLKQFDARIFCDVHVSGHAAREDLRDLINMVKPDHIIPAHGDKEMKAALAELAYEMHYTKENVHIISNGQKLHI